MFGKLLFFETKLRIKYLLKMVAMAILLLSLIYVLIFNISKIFASEDTNMEINIGVIMRNEKSLDILVNYAENMENTENTLNFIKFYSEEDAFSKLDKKEIDVLIIPPENVVNSIITGENKKVKVLFATDSPILNTVFYEVASAEANALSSVQASIYSAYDYAKVDTVEKIVEDLNKYSIQTTISRSELFKFKDVKIFEEFSMKEYYFGSVFVLAIYFSCFYLNRFYEDENLKRFAYYRVKDINAFDCTLIYNLSNFFIAFIPAIIVYIAGISLEIYSFKWQSVLYLVVLVLSVASFCDFLFMILKKRAGSIFLLVFVLFEAIAGGMIFPAQIFPKIVQKLNVLNILKYDAEYILYLFKGNFPLHFALIFLFTLLSFVLSCIVRKKNYGYN